MVRNTVNGGTLGESAGWTSAQKADESSDEQQTKFTSLPGDVKKRIFSSLASPDIFSARRVSKEWSSLIASPENANLLLQRATGGQQPVLARLEIAAGPWTQLVAETQLQRNLDRGAFAVLSGQAPYPITWAGWSVSGREALLAHGDGVWAVRRLFRPSAAPEMSLLSGTGQPADPDRFYTYANNSPATSLLIMASGSADDGDELFHPPIPATLNCIDLSSGNSTSIEPPCQCSYQILMSESGDKAVFVTSDGQIMIQNMAAPYSVELGLNLSIFDAPWTFAPGSSEELWVSLADNWCNLAVGGSGMKNAPSGQRLFLADRDPAEGVHLIALHPRSGLLATFSHSQDYVVKVWDVRNPARPPLELAQGFPFAGDFDRDGSMLALTCEDGPLRVYALADPSRPMVLRGHKKSACQVKFHPVYPYLLSSCTTDRTIKLWNLSSGGREVATIQPSRSHPYGGIFNAAGDCILATSHFRLGGGLLKPQRKFFIYDFLRPILGQGPAGALDSGPAVRHFVRRSRPTSARSRAAHRAVHPG